MKKKAEEAKKETDGIRKRLPFDFDKRTDDVINDAAGKIHTSTFKSYALRGSFRIQRIKNSKKNYNRWRTGHIPS